MKETRKGEKCGCGGEDCQGKYQSNDMSDDCLVEIDWENDKGEQCALEVLVKGDVRMKGDFPIGEAAREFWNAVGAENPYKMFVETMKEIPETTRVVVFSGDLQPGQMRAFAEDICRREPHFMILCLPEGVNVSTMTDDDLEKAGLQRISQFNS